MESVVVAAGARGLGLGRMLMADVDRRARALGFGRIVLCTSDQQVGKSLTLNPKP